MQGSELSSPRRRGLLVIAVLRFCSHASAATNIDSDEPALKELDKEINKDQG